MQVTYVIDSLVGGGAERSLAALAPLYGERGVGLDVIYLKDRPGLHDELERAGVRLFCAAGSGGRAGAARRVVRILRRRRPMLVHTTLFEADLAGRTAAFLLRIPVVTSLVNVQYGPEHFGDPSLRRWRLRGAQAADVVTARAATRMHALTEHVADVMARRLAYPRDRIDVIPRGRDPRLLGERNPERARRTRARIEVDDNVPLVVAASRQEYQKGLDVLLRAWPRVLDAHPAAVLAIAGRPGNHSAQLVALTSETGPSVRFLGARDDVPDLLSAADVFVLPSRWEGLGSVLLEAMALGAPIVASDLPPVREVVGDCADLVPADDTATLTAGIVRAIEARQDSAVRAQRAQNRFEERFTIEIVADQMRDFYARALGRLPEPAVGAAT